MVFLGALGEFFRGLAKVRLLLGELFRAGTVGGARWANFFARGCQSGGLLERYCVLASSSEAAPLALT